MWKDIFDYAMYFGYSGFVSIVNEFKREFGLKYPQRCTWKRVY
jgi:hypothetical protein